MPGLTACFSCGLDLTAPPSPPASAPQLTPRARTANPLTRRRAPTQGATTATRARQRALLGGVLLGFFPGLAAWRRGDTLLALGFAGAALLGVGLFVWTWASPQVVWATFLLWSVVMSAAATEVSQRALYPRPWGAILGVLLALTGLFTIRLVGGAILTRVQPQVYLAGTARLPGGSYLTEAVTTVQHNDLLVIEDAEPFTFRNRTPLLVAPVVAIAGDEVAQDAQAVLINDAPTAVFPLTPNARLIRQVEPFTVPEGHVVVYADPLQPVPLSRVRRLTYRWAPIRSRGPIQWPPETQ